RLLLPVSPVLSPRRPPPNSPLFPYTTLFRSHRPHLGEADLGDLVDLGCPAHLHVIPLLPVRGVSARARGRAGSGAPRPSRYPTRSEEHTSELQSRGHLVCRLLLEKKKIHTV